MTQITYEFVTKHFEYDSKIGQLRWKEHTNADLIGQIAGRVYCKGYRLIRFKSLTLKASRLIYLLFHGNLPSGMVIDHIDGNRDNNFINNLRLATSRENAHNRKIHPNTLSGIKGVYFNKRNNRWHGEVMCKGVRYQKVFIEKSEAVKFVITMREELHCQFVNHG